MSRKLVFRSSPRDGWYYQLTVLVPLELRGRAEEVLAANGLHLDMVNLDTGTLVLRASEMQKPLVKARGG